MQCPREVRAFATQADFAELITFLKTNLSSETSAVIGFGGSYGESGPRVGPSGRACQWSIVISVAQRH